MTSQEFHYLLLGVNLGLWLGYGVVWLARKYAKWLRRNDAKPVNVEIVQPADKCVPVVEQKVGG